MTHDFPLYDSDLRWSVTVTTPDHIEDLDIWASDSQEAERIAQETLIPEYGATCEDVARYVDHAVRVPKYA